MEGHVSSQLECIDTAVARNSVTLGKVRRKRPVGICSHETRIYKRGYVLIRLGEHEEWVDKPRRTNLSLNERSSSRGYGNRSKCARAENENER